MRKKSLIIWIIIAAVIAPLILYALGPFSPAHNAYMVTSGSMEPAIPTGAIVYTTDVPTERIQVGDPITFQDQGTGSLTTHRVIEKRETDEGIEFRTKGDANDSPDPGWVQADNVVGEVQLTIPYLGTAVAYAGTPIGIIALVIIPATLIILYELRNLWSEISGDQEESQLEKKSQKLSIDTENNGQESFGHLLPVAATILTLALLSGLLLLGSFLPASFNVSAIEMGLLTVLILTGMIIWIELR